MSPLDLALATPPRWAQEALADPLALLSDHAHCELGAAAAAQSLILRARRGELPVGRLAALAAEEMRHFARVHRVLARRGGELGPARRNPYVGELKRRAVAREGDGLATHLLVCALIERRSLERFGLLAREARRASGLADLESLYGGLLASEASHAALFQDLAASVEREAGERLERLIRIEADLVAELPPGPRVHSGCAGARAPARSGPRGSARSA